MCGSARVATPYHGPVRHGRFGSAFPRHLSVHRCADCDAGFLGESPDLDYVGAEYRELVDGAPEAGTTALERFHRLHDPEQADKLQQLGTDELRGRVVMDVGCGAGSFLDLVSGFAGHTIAVEPAELYHEGLRAAGHEVLSFADQLAAERRGSVDVATCFSVIEHVPDALGLLRDIRAALKPGGRLLVSTPNADDWLLELLPEDYAAFYYRTVHTWYLSARALRWMAEAAGFQGCEVRCTHRFDLSNFLLWLRDRRPSGLGRVAVPSVLDGTFRASLEASGRGDYLHALLTA
jgi:2-polyprenyl-3-methyl-5-hydroxy-6-metoxy-1,4-benzoquinol methylase